MEAALAPPHKDQALPVRESERRCLVTGEALSKDGLIRFVVGPDHSIVPDLGHDLPGRGLWIKAERSPLEMAVKKNLFSKAAKATVTVDAHLVDIVITLIRKRCLAFLGFARRSGIAVLGQPQVEAELKAGKLALLFLADDASQRLDNKNHIPEFRGFSRNELGAALGHEQLVYVGLKAHSLSGKLRSELLRLEKIAGCSHIPQGNE